MRVTCGHPNGLPIEHFHGIPNEQPQCKSMESQCTAQNTSPWNSQWPLPIQSHKSHMGLGIPNILHIRHLHGAPMEHDPCKSMGLTCAPHHDLPIEHSHGIPNDQPQCKSMESQCIAHRTIPWNAHCSLPIQSHRSHLEGVLPHVLHIRHIHGAPMEH